MLIGVDFDNTIVCYDRLFHALALEQGLIPASLAPCKRLVRDALRAEGREDDWTRLQGLAYGERLREAVPFPGVEACLDAWLRAGLRVAIVSHKTRQAYAGGGGWDLQAAARSWLADRGLLTGGLEVHFELTKQAKLRRIGLLGCDWFVDDLPEFLDEPGFPRGVRRVLFDPHGEHVDQAGLRRVAAWTELETIVAEPVAG